MRLIFSVRVRRTKVSINMSIYYSFATANVFWILIFVDIIRKLLVFPIIYIGIGSFHRQIGECINLLSSRLHSWVYLNVVRATARGRYSMKQQEFTFTQSNCGLWVWWSSSWTCLYTKVYLWHLTAHARRYHLRSRTCVDDVRDLRKKLFQCIYGHVSNVLPRQTRKNIDPSLNVMTKHIF